MLTDMSVTAKLTVLGMVFFSAAILCILSFVFAVRFRFLQKKHNFLRGKRRIGVDLFALETENNNSREEKEIRKYNIVARITEFSTLLFFTIAEAILPFIFVYSLDKSTSAGINPNHLAIGFLLLFLISLISLLWSISFISERKFKKCFRAK